MAELTPMKMQYQQIKSQYSDCLLFFRLGDFYEMFGDDARKASKELDRFHKKAYNYIQARKLVKQLEYYTHWETIFESESAAAEA